VLGSFEDLDSDCDGLLIHAENFQALNLLQERYREKVKCIYIDPPYNTGDDGFAYKDNYQHSSWISFINARIFLSKLLLVENATSFASIDDIEIDNLKYVYNQVFGQPNFIDNIIWKKRYGGGAKEKYLVSLHEYILFYTKDIEKFGKIYVPLDESSITRYYKSKDSNYSIRGPYRTHPLEATKSVGVRNNLIFPITAPDGSEIWPERQWWWDKERVNEAIEKNEIEFVKGENGWRVHTKQYLKDENGVQRKTKATSIIDNVFTQHGTSEIANMFGDSRVFLFPKPTLLIEQILQISMMKENNILLDFFAGSGPSAHAVINLNREDNGSRKYILVEMEDYFDTVLKPRIQKVIYSKDWKNGKPVSREGSSHMFKYIRLESYEDTLNNLEIKRTDKQEQLLLSDAMSKKAKEEYMLSYMLDVESKGSLLNINIFKDPFNYKLNIATGSVGETKPTKVDLVETFNYLIGLTVKHIDHIQGFCVVEGKSPQEEKVLIIWRNTKEKSNKNLETFFRKQDYSTRDMEFDLIYVNGDNNLENIRRPDETWKVRLIEEEFKRLMFEVEDV